MHLPISGRHFLPKKGLRRASEGIFLGATAFVSATCGFSFWEGAHAKTLVCAPGPPFRRVPKCSTALPGSWSQMPAKKSPCSGGPHARGAWQPNATEVQITATSLDLLASARNETEGSRVNLQTLVDGFGIFMGGVIQNFEAMAGDTHAWTRGKKKRCFPFLSLFPPFFVFVAFLQFFHHRVL